jgi:archaellum component FlaF (FlaF/FlaG flagellin family)
MGIITHTDTTDTVIMIIAVIIVMGIMIDTMVHIMTDIIGAKNLGLPQVGCGDEHRVLKRGEVCQN